MADITKIQPMGDSTQYELGARYLTTGRTISISDNDATNTGPASSAFNGTANLTVKLPSTIKASLTGNASTATTLQTTRAIKIGNKSNNFNGSANITYLLKDMQTAAQYNVGSTASNSYILVTINKETSWMLNFTLKLYQSYVATDIQISGYNYGTSHWYSPQARILGSTTTGAIKVYFGYTGDWKLWVAVDGGNYNGGAVCDVCNGYTQIDYENAFTLTKVNSLPGTTQTTVTVYRPWYRDETVSAATKLSNTPNNTTTFLRGDNTWSSTLTGGLTVNSRIYLSNWLQIQDKSGIYIPNSGSGTHFYPANDVSYGSFQMQGMKGGYHGITMGASNSYMTVMSSGVHNGLYQANTGFWAFYYNRDNSQCAIGTSSLAYKLNVAGSVICDNWFRTRGVGGWYSESYGGGWYMEDTTWIRAHNGKKMYVSNGEDNAIYTAGGVCASAPNGLRIVYGSYSFIIRNDSSNTYFMPGTASSAGNNWHGHYSYVENGNGYWHFQRAYGAVWNDYAEFRKADASEPGRVVQDTKGGKMKLVDERLAPGCKVVSDTYGFAIGETQEAKTPIAVCGRVLVYPYKNKDEYEIGAAVCSAPNGTVDIMTREEIMMYPERIIGTVSEIPDYEIWKQTSPDAVGDGKPKEYNIKVNGRIWIYVR